MLPGQGAWWALTIPSQNESTAMTQLRSASARPLHRPARAHSLRTALLLTTIGACRNYGSPDRHLPPLGSDGFVRVVHITTAAITKGPQLTVNERSIVCDATIPCGTETTQVALGVAAIDLNHVAVASARGLRIFITDETDRAREVPGIHNDPRSVTQVSGLRADASGRLLGIDGSTGRLLQLDANGERLEGLPTLVTDLRELLALGPQSYVVLEREQGSGIGAVVTARIVRVANTARRKELYAFSTYAANLVGGRFALPLPFFRTGPTWALGRSGLIAVSQSDEAEVAVLDTLGRRLLYFSVATAKRGVRDDERDSVAQLTERILARQGDQFRVAMRQQLQEAIRLQAHEHPSVEGLRVMGDSSVWLGTSADRATHWRWFLIRIDGTLRGVLELPRSIVPMEAFGDRVLLLETVAGRMRLAWATLA